MKRLIAFLMTIILLVPLLPLNAFAATGDIVTDAELAEALQLAGLEVQSSGGQNGTPGLLRGAARTSAADALRAGAELEVEEESGYHSGMVPDEAWDAQMIIDMIEEECSVRFYKTCDTFSRALVLLERMKTEAPAEYARLVTNYPMGQELYDLAVAEKQNGEEIRQEMLSLQERLKEAVVMIERMTIELTDQRDLLQDHEAVRQSEKLKKAVEDIKYYRYEAIAIYMVEVSMIEVMNRVINGTYEGVSELYKQVHPWLDEVFAWEDGPQEASAPVVTTYTGNTRMSRLTAGASLLGAVGDFLWTDALADGTYKDAHLYVVPDTQICLRVFGEENKPLSGVTVQVQDQLMENSPMLTYTTDESGRVILTANDFSADFENELDLAVWVDPTAQGYREFYVSHCYIFRGEIRTYYTKKLTASAPEETEAPARVMLLAASDSGAKPYLYSARFKNFDILHEDFEMIYSSLNDWDFDITVVVKNPGGVQYDPPVLHYYASVNDDGLRDVQPTSKNSTSYGDEYVFRGRWKQLILPEGKEKPYFTLGDEKIKTQMVSVRTMADQPLLIGEETASPISNLLKDGLGFSFTIPIGNGIKCELNIPMNDKGRGYFPKVNFTGTALSILVGNNAYIGEPGRGASWESQELKNYNKEVKKFEKESGFAKKLGELGEAYNYYKTNKLKLLQKSSFDFGFFLMVSAAWPPDKQAAGKMITLDGSAGFFSKLSYDATTVFAVGPIPGYGNFNIAFSGGFAFQLKVDMLWRNGGIEKAKFYPLRSFTVDLRLAITLTVGAGIKGIASVWVRGSIMFNLIMAINIGQPSRFAFVFETTPLTVGFELLFANYSYPLFKPYRKVLWERYAGGYSTGRVRLFDLLMSTANAEEETEEVKDAVQTPETYPALRADLEEVLSPLGFTQTNRDTVRTVTVGDQTFVFYIRQDKLDGEAQWHRRLAWVNPADEIGTQTTILDYINRYSETQELMGYHDVAIDAYSADGFAFVAVTCCKEVDEEGNPKPGSEQRTYLAMLTPKWENGSFKNLEPLWCIPSSNSLAVLTEGSFGNPTITYARLVNRESKISTTLTFSVLVSIPKYSASGEDLGTVFGSYSLQATENKIFNNKGYYYYQVRKGSPGNPDSLDDYCEWDSDLKVNFGAGLGRNYRPIKSIAIKDHMTQSSSIAWTGPWTDAFISLTAPSDGTNGDSAIEISYDPAVGGRTGIVLDHGDIQDFVVVTALDENDHESMYNDVFYAPWVETTVTDSETGEKQTIGSYRLRSLHIEPRNNNNSSFRMTKFDYDITLPTPRLRAVTFGDMSYLYWTAAVGDPDDANKTYYRLDCVSYDPSQNTMSDVTTLAELDIPEVYYYSTPGRQRHVYREGEIGEIDLTDQGRAYVSVKPVPNDVDLLRGYPANITQFSFPIPLKPVLEMQGAVLEDDTVKPGSMLGVNYALMNSGNMGVGAFDIEMHTIGADGKEGPLVQTLHADLLDMRRSSLVEAGTGRVLASGTAALTRAEDYGYGGKQRDWVVKSETTTTYMSGGQRYRVEDNGSDAQYVRTDMLVPGALASLNSALFIPYSWAGHIDIRMRLTNVTTYSNWSGVLSAVAKAQASGTSGGGTRLLAANTAGGGTGLLAAANGGGSSLNSVMASLPGSGLDIDSIIAGVDGARKLVYEYDESSGKLKLQEEPVLLLAASASGEEDDEELYATEIEAPDQFFTLDIEGDDLEVGHHLYYDSYGEYVLDIVLMNTALHSGTGLRLTCAVYLDGAEDPFYVNLPYDADQLAHGRTQTISIPINAVFDPSVHRSARFEIRGVDFEETAYANNSFTLWFDNPAPLTVTVQPADAMAGKDGDAVFTVEVTGGTGAYTYQWQTFNNGRWLDITGANDSTLTMSVSGGSKNGGKVRCVVTDEAGEQVISKEATFTVPNPAPTGDRFSLPLLLAIALIAVLLLVLVRRRAKKVK